LQSLPHRARRSITLDRGTEYPSPICRLTEALLPEVKSGWNSVFRTILLVA